MERESQGWTGGNYIQDKTYLSWGTREGGVREGRRKKEDGGRGGKERMEKGIDK